MHPSNNYKDMFAGKLQNVPHLNLPVYSKRTGLYAVALPIGVRTEMSDQRLFLGKPYSNTWIQDQIDTVITNDQALSDVWICIDGSNNNCTAAVDGQAVKEMIVTLKGYGISPRGVVLDRGFCDAGCIRMLEENSFDYVIMMKENTNGFHQLLDQHRDEIRLQWKYALGNGMFGTSDKVKLFQKSSLEVNASLIWDAKNGIDRASYLIDEVMEAIQKAETAVSCGKPPVIPAKYKEYLSIPKVTRGLHVQRNCQPRRQAVFMISETARKSSIPC